MKSIFRFGWFGLLPLVVGAATEGMADSPQSGAESLVVIAHPVADPPKVVARRPAIFPHRHEQLMQLVRQDAGAFTAPPVETVESSDPAVPTEDVLKLERMTVLGKKIVIPPPVRETPAQEFFRTGTIWATKDGRMKLWMKGDRGIMFTFAW